MVDLLTWYYTGTTIFERIAPAQFFGLVLMSIIMSMSLVSFLHAFHCWANDEKLITEFWTGVLGWHCSKETPTETMGLSLGFGILFGIIFSFFVALFFPFILICLLLFSFGFYYRKMVRSHKRDNEITNQNIDI